MRLWPFGDRGEDRNAARLVEAVRDLAVRAIEAEFMTQAGVVNVVTMVLAALIALGLMSAAALEALVRLFRQDAEIGLSPGTFFPLFFGYSIACVVMLAYLDRQRGGG